MTPIKTLEETVDLMLSSDPDDQFKAEYFQLENRFITLNEMLAEWDEGVRILKKTKKTPLIEEMTDFAEVASIHWHADVIHTR